MIKNIEKEVEGITKWIRDYVENAGAKGVVVGNSGGKDSATVIALLERAIGKEKILTVAMPCESIKQDFDDAKLVADTFNVPLIEVDLTKTYETIRDTMKEVEKTTDEKIKREADINIKPRLRMITQYHLAQTLGYLVIGTGNKSEYTVGYSTKWGDAAYDFTPIKNFTATEVYELAKYLGVPERIIKKAPNDGLGGMTDEEKLGVTYAQIDEYIETGKTEEKALEKIKQKEKNNEHKRKPVPAYERL